MAGSTSIFKEMASPAGISCWDLEFRTSLGSLILEWSTAMFCFGAAAGAFTIPMPRSELITAGLAPGRIELFSALVYWEGLVPLSVFTFDPPLPLEAGATVTRMFVGPSETLV